MSIILGDIKKILGNTKPIISSNPPQSLFSDANTPSFTGVIDTYELGVKFQTTKNGLITGFKFWKSSASEIGTHTGNLWDNAGNLLVSAEFLSKTAVGWQTQMLSVPYRINSGTSYTFSTNNVSNYFSSTENGFASGLTVGDLIVLSGEGNNGVYNETVGNFPTLSFNQSNYYRDIIFVPD